jgi:hypothetical protein
MMLQRPEQQPNEQRQPATGPAQAANQGLFLPQQTQVPPQTFTNYPALPNQLLQNPQPGVMYESYVLPRTEKQEEPVLQIPLEKENFARMPEDQFLSNSFQILSDKKRLKKRFELLDTIIKPLNLAAPLVEAQAKE